MAAFVATSAPAAAQVADAQRVIVTLRSAADVSPLLTRLGGRRVGPNGWAGIVDPAVARGLPGVVAVTADAPVRAQNTVPNDPCVTTCNMGQSQWYLAPIGASSAWDRSKGDGVTIAVLDSGVDPTHPDLAGKVTVGPDFTDAHDGNGNHATEVAGIAGAATNNGTGVASVGWNVGILSEKVLDINGEGFTSWVINGIDDAIARGAKIVNLSLAGTTFEQPLQDAINRAYAKNVLVVAAAGNNDDQGGSATDPKYPAAMDHVLSVAASQQNDTLASFSRRGSTVDIAAPGSGLLTTQSGGGYGPASGTSLAAPLVSAAAALVIAEGLGIEATPDAVSAQLVRSGVPIPNGLGGTMRRLQIGLGTQTVAPYGLGFAGGDAVAVGELDANAAGEEIVTAAGPGGGPHVRVWSASLNALPVGFYAYGANFHGGVDVAVGDAVADSPGDEIVTGAGPGGGPHVRTFLANGTPAPGQAGDGFFAYGPTFHGGVSLAVGDVRPDIAGDEIVTGALSNGGPHVRVFTADGAPLGDGFMAFDPRFSGGVSVAVGNFDTGNQGLEIAVAAGPGGGPHVRIFRADGSSLGGGFFAYDGAFTGGVRIAAAQLDNGADEVITVPRTGGGPHLRAFHADGSPIGGGIFAFDGRITTGLHVAAGATEVVIGTRGAPTLARALALNALA